MGMFDDVLLKNVKCQHCGKKIKEINCQTKDFGCTLDQFNQGDDVREKTQRWLLQDGSLTRYEGAWKHHLELMNDKKIPASIRKGWKDDKEEDYVALTRKQIKEKYGDRSKYKLHFWKSSGKNSNTMWGVYKYIGLSNKNWSDVKNREFNCGGKCPKCKTWNEFVAIIRNYLFIGVEE